MGVGQGFPETTYYMKGVMIPDAFPIVNCIPLAVVRLPYRGLLLGSHASGRPTTTYSPVATKMALGREKKKPALAIPNPGRAR